MPSGKSLASVFDFLGSATFVGPCQGCPDLGIRLQEHCGDTMKRHEEAAR